MYPQIPIDRIDDSPFQTRITYDETRVVELADSIESDGLMQPPIGRVVNGLGVVQPIDGSMVMQDLAQKPALRVQLAFGHTRLRALRQIWDGWGREERLHGIAPGAMPVVIKPLTDEQMDMLAWSENKERSDLNAIEEAKAIADRIDRRGWTHEQAGEELGLSRSAVSNKLRLLRLPEHVRQHVAAGELSEGKARAFVSPFEFWNNLSDEDRAVVDWHREKYGHATGDPEDLLEKVIEYGWGPDSITSRAIDAETIDRWREWKEREERYAAEAKAAEKHPEGKSPEQVKREKIREQRKAKAAKMEARLVEVLSEQLGDFTSAEAGDRVLAALAIGHSTKPTLAKAAELLGVEVEKGYGIDENLEATAYLSVREAIALGLAAMMFKEIDQSKDWDAPTPVYDAMMRGVEVEAAAGERNAAILRGEATVEEVVAEQDAGGASDSLPYTHIAYGYLPDGAPGETVSTVVYGLGVSEGDARRDGEHYAKEEGYTGSLHVVPCTPVLAEAIENEGGETPFEITGGIARLDGESVSAETSPRDSSQLVEPSGTAPQRQAHTTAQPDVPEGSGPVGREGAADVSDLVVKESETLAEAEDAEEPAEVAA